MQISINKKAVYRLLDTILPRWKAEPKQFPYNKKDAIIPQTVIPDDLRANKETLARFYFYLCIYMRGGIESLQAFNALIRMWREHPIFFDPYQAQWLSEKEVEDTLKEYIGWDSEAAGENWVQNSRRLMQYWQGNPLNLLKGLRDYDEALRRMRNKENEKRAHKAAGEDGLGFRGFQPKMVSMLLYFYDWEGWLEKRFLYPAPADFHNFRLGLAHGGIVLTPMPEKVVTSERISKLWRDVIMGYMRLRKADPIEVADAIWMFSLVMCGNSPVTMTRNSEKDSGMFEEEDLPYDAGELLYQVLRPRRWKALKETCLSCPILSTCTLAIPSRPYYRKGFLLLQDRPKVEKYLGTFDPDAPSIQQVPVKTIDLPLGEPVE